MSDNDSSSIGWFLAGLGIGALVGVLYAPKSGRETRDTILQSANQGRDYLTRNAQELRTQADQWVQKGKETINRSKDQITSAVEAGRQAYREAVDKG
ncbi:MAG: YtxH domain-containing protein [Acidobacteria bacterium]|nr:YtxH domain-containing protein [Acidobacteriota bacterium]MBV9436525.1 YtxH domain-containing protein [Acidobacteriota bacterium]